jgi:hypothetical protein
MATTICTVSQVSGQDVLQTKAEKSEYKSTSDYKEVIAGRIKVKPGSLYK